MDSLPSEPPGKPKKTGVGSLSLFQRIFLTQELSQGLLHCGWIFFTSSATREDPIKKAHRILVSWPGIEPTFPALEAGVLTTIPLGKSQLRVRSINKKDRIFCFIFTYLFFSLHRSKFLTCFIFLLYEESFSTFLTRQVSGSKFPQFLSEKVLIFPSLLKDNLGWLVVSLNSLIVSLHSPLACMVSGKDQQ